MTILENQEVIIQNLTVKRELFNDESRQETDRIYTRRFGMVTFSWQFSDYWAYSVISWADNKKSSYSEQIMRNHKAFYLTFENDLELSGINFHFQVELSILYFYCIVFIFSSKS